MKRTVFFILCIFMFGTTYSVEANVYDGVVKEYDFNEYRIETTSYLNEHGRTAYHIEKKGLDPFNLEIDREEYQIFFKGLKEINGNHVFYGWIYLRPEEARVFDAYIVVVGQTGDILYETTYDCGYDETVLDVYELDSQILLKIWSYDHFARDQIEYFTELRTVDNDFKTIDSIQFSEYHVYSHVKDGYYFYGEKDYEYLAMVDSNLDIYYKDDSLSIAMNQVFIDNVRVPIVNEGYLNGVEVSNGLYIDYPGYYELEYNDTTYQFTVATSILGIEHGGVYDNSVTPMFSNGNATMNGEAFITNTIIENPGYYTFELQGLNGYSEIMDFTITSGVTGVEHNKTYEKDLLITFNGDGYLNNVHVTSPLSISDEGEYIFKIKGEHDYLETYFFSLEDVEEQNTVLNIIQTYDIVIFVVVIGTGYFILKKKK